MSMAGDVVTETLIDRLCVEVADHAGDPDSAPAWYMSIKSVEWKTPPSLAVGSRLAFVAHCLVAPLIAAAMRRANREDLARPKLIL
jgi:hypothetical protein